MNTRFASLFVFTAAAVLAQPLLAEIRTGDTVTVAADETVDGNLYASAGTLLVHGAVTGDLVGAAGTIIIDGRVGGDVLAVGGEVTVSGSVGGDLRAAGGQVAVSGPVGGDAALAGGDIVSGGQVAGDAILAGGSLRSDGSVRGDLDARGGSLALGGASAVTGDVDYAGNAPLLRASGATVGGAVRDTRTAVSVPTAASVDVRVVLWLQALTGTILLGLFWLLLFRGFAERAVLTLRTHPGLSAGVGAATLFATPVLLTILLAAGAVLGGWWLALFGGAIYGIAIALAVPLVAACLGTLAFERVARPARPLLSMFLAAVVLFVASAIPLVGGLVMFAAVILGLGALVLTLVPTLQQTRKPMTTVPAPQGLPQPA